MKFARVATLTMITEQENKMHLTVEMGHLAAKSQQVGVPSPGCSSMMAADC